MNKRAVATVVFVLLGLVIAPVGPVSSQSPDTVDSPPLTEVAAPIIVEAAPLLAPGPDGELPPGTQDDMEDNLRELKARSDRAESTRIGLPPNDHGAAYGGIAAVYNSSHPAPSSVRAVVDAAVNQWDSVLSTNPAGPIVIEIYWSNLGNSSLLGYAGPDGMYYGGGLPTSALYPAALTNTLLGQDANGAARPEVQVVLNSQLLDSNRWYLGTTGSPAGNQIDLYSVVLHEIGHGLGFLGSATIPSGQSSPSLNSPPYVYDTAATHGGSPITASGDQGGALLSGDVHIGISAGLSYELFAPSTWSQGSSFSHFDEHAYGPGSPGALMTPMLGSGEVARTLDGPTVGLMAHTGWPTTLAALTPTITAVSPSLTAAVVQWAPNLGQVGLAPDSYTVEAWRDGASLQSSVTVSGGDTTAAVHSLTPGQSYVIKVIPTAQNGNGAAATQSVQLLSASPPADPASWPNYIRNLPLDGQVNRLYQAYFLRLPDQGGYDYWVDQRSRSAPLVDVSNAFAASSEFQASYGSLSNDAFVDLVYANVLNRGADSQGRAYWISRLNAGTSRGEVMVGFAESAEYIARTGTVAATGTVEAKVGRLYQAFFLRAPDSDGQAYWTGQANAGASLESMAAAFTQSSEFQNRYGALSDQQFVQLVYSNVLQRQPDGDGLAYWTGLLQSGIDRGAMMVGFSESGEFIRSTGTIP